MPDPEDKYEFKKPNTTKYPKRPPMRKTDSGKNLGEKIGDMPVIKQARYLGKEGLGKDLKKVDKFAKKLGKKLF